MAPKAIALGIRFVGVVVVYSVIVMIWISNSRGWRILDLLGASIIFGFVAAASWALAAAIGQALSDRTWRFFTHPVTTVLLFVALAYLVVGLMMGMEREVDNDLQPFALLVAGVAVVDSVVALLLDRWLAQRGEGAH